MQLSNILDPAAPIGGEADFVVIEHVGTPRTFDFQPKDHVELGKLLGAIDTERGAKVAGSRSYYLTGVGAMLEFALVNYAISSALKAGFTPVIPPVLVNPAAMEGTGFLGQAAENVYHLEKDDVYLVGTSEVPLAAMHMDEVLPADKLPLRYASDDLISETSHSFLTSLDWTKVAANSEAGLTLEAFYTRLNDPFVLEQLTETIWEKRNGKGANVYGINMEAKYAPGQKWQFQGGATVQKALYDKAVQWSDNIVNTNENFFRSPNVYGNLMTTFSPKKAFQNNISLVYTGSMYVPHFAGYIPTDTLEKTDHFFEVNIKSSYVFEVKEKFQIQLSGGIQNILNSYQSDFDKGVDRDASYIYGPSRPRTFFIGLKFGTDLL
jgi:outer membrane receptor for ferrienterochelin and colicins